MVYFRKWLLFTCICNTILRDSPQKPWRSRYGYLSRREAAVCSCQCHVGGEEVNAMRNQNKQGGMMGGDMDVKVMDKLT